MEPLFTIRSYVSFTNCYDCKKHICIFTKVRCYTTVGYIWLRNLCCNCIESVVWKNAKTYAVISHYEPYAETEVYQPNVPYAHHNGWLPAEHFPIITKQKIWIDFSPSMKPLYTTTTTNVRAKCQRCGQHVNRFTRLDDNTEYCDTCVPSDCWQKAKWYWKAVRYGLTIEIYQPRNTDLVCIESLWFEVPIADLGKRKIWINSLYTGLMQVLFSVESTWKRFMCGMCHSKTHRFTRAFVSIGTQLDLCGGCVMGCLWNGVAFYEISSANACTVETYQSEIGDPSCWLMGDDMADEYDYYIRTPWAKQKIWTYSEG